MSTRRRGATAFAVALVVVAILVAALLIAGGTSSRRATPGASGSSASSGATATLPPLPDFATSVGSIASDVVASGGAGPTTTAGLDVRFLSFRDPTQGFSGPQLDAQIVIDLDPKDSTSMTYGETSKDAAPVAVGGRRAYLTALGGVVLLGVPPSGGITEGLLFVGYQVSEPQLLRAAESMQRTADGTWSMATPPDGLALAASGTDTAPSERARRITIAGATPADLVVHDGDASTFEGLVRDRVESATTVSATTVDGVAAVVVVAAGSAGDRSIIWQPTPDSVAELHSTAADDAVRAIATGLHRTS